MFRRRRLTRSSTSRLYSAADSADATMIGSGTPVLQFHVVDVFTDRPFAGNPLAIVLGAEGLSTEQMQQLAAQFHLSETAFPLFPSGEQGADYRLRIFTPEVELPFAGHPSVGTAWLLRELGLIGVGTFHQLCGAGVLAVEVGEQQVTLSGGVASLGDPIDPGPALAAVGLAEADLVELPARVASAGLGYAVVPVRPGALTRCAADLSLLRASFAHPSPATGVYVVTWEDDPSVVRARMFAGDVGVTEDPATGSAALAYGVYAAGTGLLPTGRSSIEITQGVEMGRPSQLTVTVDSAAGAALATELTGRVSPVASGTIAIPP
jgi:trans-2,3-dihydro-3-hydroxyanthranilate isomerase